MHHCDGRRRRFRRRLAERLAGCRRSSGIYAQRFDSLGNKVGGEFRVNTNYTNGQATPAVAMDSAGNFVIAGRRRAILQLLQRCACPTTNAQGQKVGSEIRVNSANVSGTNLLWHQRGPSVGRNQRQRQLCRDLDKVTSQSNGVVMDTVVVGVCLTARALRSRSTAATPSSK